MKRNSVLWKRIVGCVLTATMLTGILAGCGSTETQQSSETSKPAESSSEVKESSEAQPSEEEEKPMYPIEGDVTLTMAMLPDANLTNQGYDSFADSPLAQAWQEATGVTLEVIHPADTQAMNLLTASGELPDIVYMAYNDYEPLIADKVAVPLNDYMEYAPDWKAVYESDELYQKTYTTSDGSIVGFPFIRGDEYLLISQGIVIREDMLKKVGKEMPKTPDELYEALKAFKEELGVEYPMNMSGLYYLYRSSGMISGGFGLPSASQYQKDGQVHWGATEPEYKELLAWLNKLYDEQILEPNFQVTTGAETNAAFMNDESALAIVSVGGGIGTFMNTMKESNPEFSAVGIPSLVENSGDTPMMGHWSSPAQRYIAFVTTDCENVEAAVKFLNYGYTEEGHMLFNFGIEGESYTMVDGYPTYTELITNNPDGLAFGAAAAPYVRSTSTGPFVQDKRYMEQFAGLPQQKQSLENWTNTNSADYALPALMLSVEEANEYNVLWADIESYIEESAVKFITGEWEMDKFETEYLPTLEKMDLERCLELRQISLDAWNAK